MQTASELFAITAKYCQALSISQSLNLSLSLRDRDRADTIFTLYHTTTTPLKTFKDLIGDL